MPSSNNLEYVVLAEKLVTEVLFRLDKDFPKILDEIPDGRITGFQVRLEKCFHEILRQDYIGSIIYNGKLPKYF